MDRCLDDDALAAYIDGALQPQDVSRIDRHIDECPVCRGDLSAMAIALGSDTLAADGEAGEGGLGPGDTIGRYVVVHEHARGGMGVVAVANDPELARKVAIKVLRSEVSDQRHLRDEARAMASLSHPNVVSVHDVGAHAGRIFLAMELVDGVSLRGWLAVGDRRSWRTIVATCIAAGRGLAAAHRAGIVHRDFKPDNVLCGPGERVRVTDFGLARHDGIAVARAKNRTGLVGTPRYMAPEVWRGEPATALSDQWSFCVTLFEALFGAAPFDGKTTRELGEAVQRGTFAFPARTPVPARVTRVIARGLHGTPAERFASLDELLDELSRALRTRVAPWLVAGGAVVVAGAAIAFAALSSRPELCEIPPTLLDGAWDAGSRSSLEAAFATSGRKHAPTTARRVADILDSYRAEWLDARREACVATRVRGDQSDAVLDARSRCLDRRRAELASLVRVFVEHPTPEVVDRAVQAAHDLHPIDTCSALAATTEHPLPAAPDRAALVIALDRELAAIRASQLVARVDTMEARTRSVVERAKPLGYPPLYARATQLLAKLATYSSDHASAERNFQIALDAAAAAHDDRTAAEVWIDLVAFSAMEKGDAALALTHARTAEVAVLRADSPRELRGAFLHARGIAFAMQGKYDEARDSFERSLREAPRALDAAITGAALCNVELRLGKVEQAATRCWKAAADMEVELGPTHPTVGFTLLNAGNVALQQHDYTRAKDAFVRALAIIADSLGERHVAYALTLNNLAMIEERADDIAGARRDYLRALALLDKIGHPEAFVTRLNLGNLARRLGKADEARTYWNDALAIAERTHGKDSDRAAQIWGSLGALDVDLDRYDDAEREYTRSLEIAEKLFGEKHPQVADALDGLGFVYSERGDCRRAMVYQRRAIAVHEAIYGPDHPRLGDTLTSLGSCQTSTGDPAALVSLERSVAIHDHHPDDSTFDAAASRWYLARALIRFGGDRARAATLASQASALYAKSTESLARNMPATIDRWLAEHHLKR